jgi:hypothetical protein
MSRGEYGTKTNRSDRFALIGASGPSDDSILGPFPKGVIVGVLAVLAYKPVRAFIEEAIRIPRHTAGFLRGRKHE